MAVYTLKLDPDNNGEFGSLVSTIEPVVPPFTFGPDDVVTVIAEVKDRDTGITYSGREPLEIGVTFETSMGRVAVYLPRSLDGARVSLSSSNMTGDNPYLAEIRRGDLFEPVYNGNASIISYNNNIPLYGIDKTRDLSVREITMEYRSYDWIDFSADYYLTFITPDGGGASKFWTGFKGCGELD